MEAFLVSFPGLVIISILGMLVHFMKKNIKGETTTEVANFFKDHFKSTFIAVVMTFIGVASYYYAMATGQTADILIGFGCGYTFDSMFNKWDKKEV